MFLLMCQFAENRANEKQVEVCAEFKTGFFDKLKSDYPDTIFAM
jgi:hypothetical protein